MQIRDHGKLYEGPEPTGQAGREFLRRWAPILGRAGVPGMVQGGRMYDAGFVLVGHGMFDELAEATLAGWTCDGEPFIIADADPIEVALTVLTVLGKSGFFGQAFRRVLEQVETSQHAKGSASPSPAQ